MTGTTEMKKKKGERRWNRWTDKKLGELFQIVRLLELRVQLGFIGYARKRFEKYLENGGGAYSAEIRVRIRKGCLISRFELIFKLLIWKFN